MRFSGKWVLGAFIVGTLIGAVFWNYWLPRQVCITGSTESVLSPGARAPVSAFLLSAQKSLDVEMYEFTTASGLIDVLEAAKLKGVSIRVILEPTVDQNLATAQKLRAAGIEVRWASGFSLTHAKMTIADNQSILIGSTNWSKSALDTNRETSIVIHDPDVTATYVQAFASDWAQARVAS